MQTQSLTGTDSPSSPGDTAARRTRLFLIVRRAPDYPAAHSMDCVWYAVDANGAVGIFSSGEAGPVPRSATQREHGDIPRLIRILGGECDDDDFDLQEAFQSAGDRGLYVYEVVSWECDFLDTYDRVAVPKRRLHLNQLPPNLRKNFAKCTLPTTDFAKEQELQVVGLVACDLYWDEAVGCFAPGHKEIRPIPGKEAEYRVALPSLRRENPDFQFAEPVPVVRKGPPPLPPRPEEP